MTPEGTGWHFMLRVKEGNFLIVMQRPSFYSGGFNDFFVVNNLTLQYNDKRLQSMDSNACGYYCVYYLINRCRGVPMEEILHTFSNNLNNNDTFVFDFVRNTFPYCVKGFDGK